MKIIKSILLFITVIAFACACSNEDENVSIQATESYAGTYRVIGMYDHTGNYSSFSTCYPNAFGFYRTYVFDEIGNYSYYYTCQDNQEYDETGTYFLLGDRLTLKNDNSNITHTVSGLPLDQISWTYFRRYEGVSLRVELVLKKI